jgi:hypothetical protein
MERQMVSSSCLKSVGYDPDRCLLEIEFLTGGVYQYFEVPESIFRELMAAPSHGKYFLQHIRDKYRYQRIR